MGSQPADFCFLLKTVILASSETGGLGLVFGQPGGILKYGRKR